MNNKIKKHKNIAWLSIASALVALTFCIMFGKDTIETEYYSVLNKYYPPTTSDYMCYFIPRIVCLISALFSAYQFKKAKNTQKFLDKNTASVTKVIYKGTVIAKDSKSTTSGNADYISTSHSYTTSVRVHDLNETLYFYGKDIYMNCTENENVGVLITSNLDKNGRVLATWFDFMNNYEQYQKIKDSYINKNQCEIAVTENIPWGTYIIK